MAAARGRRVLSALVLCAACIAAAGLPAARADTALALPAGGAAAPPRAQAGAAAQCGWVRDAFLPDPYCDVSSGGRRAGPAVAAPPARARSSSARAVRGARAHAASGLRGAIRSRGAPPSHTAPPPRPQSAGTAARLTLAGRTPTRAPNPPQPSS
jgi:hypothetical protein